MLIVLSAASAHAAQSAFERQTQTILAVTFVVVTIAIGVLAVLWNYRNAYSGTDSLWRYALRLPLVKLGLATILLVLGVSMFVPDPKIEDPYERIAFARNRQMPSLAVGAYRQLIGRYPYIMRYHYGYISAFYEQDEWGEEGEVAVGDGQKHSPVRYYQNLYRRHLRRPGMADVGRLGLGICEYFEFMNGLAERQFETIEDTTMPYRNLFLGRIALRRGEPEVAMRYFQQELDIGVEKQLAVANMARVLMRYDRDNLAAMKALIDDPETAAHAPVMMKRLVYTKEADMLPYIGAILESWGANLQFVGFLGALLGLAIWVFFLRWVDIFKRKKWWSMLAMIGLGAAFTILSMPLYDVIRFEWNFDLTGDFWHDFLYCIAGIGFVEELVKIIPFLLVLRFTNFIRGPLDYIIYASLSALGFAFVENLLYFDGGNVSIMHGRILVAAVSHMFDTATIAFAMVLARYRFGGYHVPLFIAGFLVAAILHGIYDFWLINPVATSFWFITYIVFIYQTFQYAAYLNNALNQSPVFRGRVILNTNRLATRLLIALMSVLLFEYFALSVIYGPSVGNGALIRSMGMGSFLMFFVVLNLSYIDVVQGEWFALRLWNFGTRQNFNQAIGKSIQLLPNGPKSVLSRALPARGEIIARIKLKKDNRFFLVEFDQPVDLLGHELPFVLIKARDKYGVITPGQQIEVAVVAFRDRDALIRREKQRSDFRLLDYAVVR